jgi:SAM-dependent methyltransferase
MSMSQSNPAKPGGKPTGTSYAPDAFDPTRLKHEARTQVLEAKVAYLLDEVSGLRTLVRHLIADRIDQLPIVRQTRSSFNYQWRNLPEGQAMLSNPEFRARVPTQISELADLPKEWFTGKRVMDAGCGQGRWTYGFGQLGVGTCVSVDISEAGVSRTREVAKEFPGRIEVYQKNLLEDLGFAPDFDLVWCFGVLHHTGKTYVGFQNLARCVKPGGYLFLMIYGEPRPFAEGEYRYYHEMFDMRTRLRNLPFEEKVAVLRAKYGEQHLHGYFDAISPDINDLYRWDELVSWFAEAGFTDIKRTLDHPNHHIVARKAD